MGVSIPLGNEGEDIANIFSKTGSRVAAPMRYSSPSAQKLNLAEQQRTLTSLMEDILVVRLIHTCQFQLLDPFCILKVSSVSLG